jgi:dihydroneopterin aldolase
LLLESLVYRVAEEILKFDGAITSVNVAVRKTRPPVPEDVASVGVRCTLCRP